MASPSVRRPSASVLLISTVLPAIDWSTSPSLYDLPDGMFSVQAASACTSIGQLLACEHADRADHRRGAGHVDLHVLHRGRRLEREAARVERDALADEHDLLLTAPFGLVGEVNEARLLVAALGDGEEHAHAIFAAGGAVEHGELEAGFARDLLRDLGEALRGHDAGRLVDEATRLARRRARSLARARWAAVALRQRVERPIRRRRSDWIESGVRLVASRYLSKR